MSTHAEGSESAPVRRSRGVRRGILLGCLFALPIVAANAADEPCAGSDYPTTAIADYVLACMSANGNSYESLHQCSCSIDYIREHLSYAEYERAETVMQAQLDRGQRGIFYRDAQQPKAMVERLQSIQAESTLRCF